MCLIIDTNIHKPEKRVIRTSYDNYTSRIAQRDIVVYKALEPEKNSPNTGRSPYRAFIWRFGKRVNRRGFTLCHTKYKWALATINEGLHACTTRTSALRHVHYGVGKVFPAIIPRGSRVVFGIKNEIVSNSLIVYKNMEDLEAVHGKVAQGVKKKLIAI